MTTIRIAMAAVLMLGLGSAPSLLPAATSAQTLRTGAALHTVTFAVENMTCTLCPITVKRAIEAVVGVRTVGVDFDRKTATVTFDRTVADAATVAAA